MLMNNVNNDLLNTYILCWYRMNTNVDMIIILFLIFRMATARGKAELSDIAADHAREDYEIAKLTAKQFAPDFIQPGVFRTFLCNTPVYQNILFALYIHNIINVSRQCRLGILLCP